ncbi:MAG: DNA polymerase III subunit beta [Planctomycetota bacterium]|nr:DNA polymerase III subunit beta [Planctomycetota bacterium]
MKVTLPTQALIEGIGHGAAVAASKSPKPILECVALHASQATGVSLEATDLDVGIRYQLDDAAVAEEGSLVVPASRLLSIVREVDEDETTLQTREGNLSVDTGRSHFKVRGENIEEFRRLPYFPETAAATVPAGLLRNLIRRTRFAAATEAGRFALHGVLLNIKGKSIEMVATDGRRLARAAGTLAKKAARDVRVIVGPKGLGLLERVLATSDASGEVSVAVEERQVLFRAGGALVVSRLIDGTFPAYEDVIPKSSKYSFEVTTAEFAAGLRRTSLMTTRDALSIEVLIDPETLTLKSRAVEVGQATIEVPVRYEGPPTRIGFNPQFLQDALKVMDAAAEITVRFTDGKAPVTLSDLTSDGGEELGSYVYVIMPVALE